MVFCVANLHTQNPVPKTSLTANDRKDLEKITKLLHKAEGFENQAEETYEQIDNLKKEKGLSDGADQVKQLRTTALKKDIQAFEKKKEAHRIKYQMYKRHLDKFKGDSASGDMNSIKAKLLIEDADQFFYRASTLRNEAYNQTSEPEKKFEKLEKAHSIEKLGLEKVEKALSIYYSKGFDKQEGANKLSKKDIPDIDNEKVVVNRDLLRNIKLTLRQVDNRTFRDKFQNLQERDTVGGKELVDLWYAYLYPDRTIQPSGDIDAEIKTSGDTVSDKIQSKEELAEKTSQTEETDESERQAPKDEATPKEQAQKEKEAPNTDSEKLIVEKEQQYASGLIYRVQIAADKKPLSQATLRKLYDGDKQISRVVENGWYKYSIGDFSTFDNAEAFKNDLKTRDAFIVAYKDGEPVSPERAQKDDITEPEKEKPPDEKTEPKPLEPVEPAKTTSEVVFKVQIAASRNPMSDNLLHNIYGGDKEINKNIVDGWYKYSVGQFPEYEAANKLKKKTNVGGAFITAYKDGELLDIKQAIQLSEGRAPQTSPDAGKNVSREGVTFKVQIAADRIQLGDKRLKEIYSGVKKVDLNKGEGWYRYSIGQCPTYFHAKQLRRKTGVRGAFVVAYKNGQRLNAYKLRSSRVQCPELSLTEFNENQNQITFAVQVSASSSKLNKHDLKFIYCGNHSVHEHHIGQWYKYAVGSFRNYEQAANLKKTICVPGAFVVAYKGARQIDIKQAINQSKR
jgi:hypothetical protein